MKHYQVNFFPQDSNNGQRFRLLPNVSLRYNTKLTNTSWLLVRYKVKQEGSLPGIDNFEFYFGLSSSLRSDISRLLSSLISPQLQISLSSIEASLGGYLLTFQPIRYGLYSSSFLTIFT